MKSPAKINLGLQVHHKRESDGLHCISSIFIPISFCDDLLVENSQEDRLISEIDMPAIEARAYLAVSEKGDLSRNIVWQVLEKTRLWRTNERGALKGLFLTLTKRLPTGGGLGGGSSNAGTLLSYIASLYRIPKIEVSLLAQEIGADVSFFLQKDACLIWGSGELYEPIEVGKGLGVLCISGIKVDTKSAYGFLKRTLQGAPAPKTMRGLDNNALLALQSSDWKSLAELENDFESPVFVEHPVLNLIKDAFIAQGADFSMMSGSGSVVYALVANVESQLSLQQSMAIRFPDCRFVSFSF